MTDAYDEHPYTQHAYAETNPRRVAAVARLARWEPGGLDGARVLELGCGRGGNLLPMAAGLPATTFVGVDRSARQIGDAERVATGAKISNVTFVCASFDEFDALEPSKEPFEYIVCHGVVSWIAPADRRLLFARIARWLSPDGIACLSFNVLPGWYDRLAARDWLQFATSSLGVVPETASQSLQWLAAHASPDRGDHRRRLGEIARRLSETGPAYARHEYLAVDHFPLSVRTFLHEASTAGLAYLGDAIPSTTALELLSDEVQRRAAPLNEVEAQQLIDFVQCTAFRRALLVRADEARERGWRAPRHLDRRAVRSLWVGSRLRSSHRFARGKAFETFEGSAQTVQISDPALRRALHELARVAPAALAFDALARHLSDGAESDPCAMEVLASELLDLWLATGAIDFLSAPPRLSAVAGERPIACPLARWQAKHGGVVTNRLHQEVDIPDAIVRWVLLHLDGTRTVGDLAREARSHWGATHATATDLDSLVAACVDRLATCGLVVDSA